MGKRLLAIDERGRVTLPPELRKESDSFSYKIKKNGDIILIPHKSISIHELKLLEKVKRSIKQMNEGKTKPFSEDELDD